MLEREIPTKEFQSKGLVNKLRTKYLEMLMAPMRVEVVDFCDRFVVP